MTFSRFIRAPRRVRLAALAGALAIACVGAGAPAASATPTVAPAGHAAATLESCLANAATATGATATFGAHMTLLPGAYEMEMRFEILERSDGEAGFHKPIGVGAPGVGAWRVSGAHVGVFKDYDEVVDLTGPAEYRAKVRFRWLGPEGEVLHWAEKLTEPCRAPRVSSESPN